MSNPSRQYSFLHNENGFSISLIEGHSLIQELSQIHNIGPHALNYYRSTVLSSLQMLNFLKPGENLGFYIDSEEPYYRFKIEISNNGQLRTLLLPEDFEDFPTKLTGNCRLNKMSPGHEPYSSILDFTEHPVKNLINEVLEKSYQTKSKIIISDDCSSSIMVTKLPPTNINKKIEDFDDLSLEDIIKKFDKLIKAALLIPDADVKTMEELFSQAGLTYLGSKEVRFHCPCSHERMVENLFTLSEKDREHIFQKRPVIETRCDYCNTVYEIKKEEIIKPLH
ncbi:MAG: Hsp33 family molecular chaperone HslO [Bacteriovoracaceae bacterium]|jgi:molecular chaperone Hsp33|nr:Hsp33 family molecular chaperone HslO [Bacteriovoracaceae bacterium]